MNTIIIVDDNEVHHNNFGVQYKYTEDLHHLKEDHASEQSETEFVLDTFDTSLDIVVLPTDKTK